jgi:hypothetical protein
VQSGVVRTICMVLALCTSISPVAQDAPKLAADPPAIDVQNPSAAQGDFAGRVEPGLLLQVLANLVPNSWPDRIVVHPRSSGPSARSR